MPAFTGSCACGHVKLVLCMELPPIPDYSAPPPKNHTLYMQIYKCNCTRCHKFGFFHIRPTNPETDFYLLSPLNPLTELGDFRPVKHWFFCKTCGTRPFTFDGDGEVVEKDFSDMGENVKHLGKQRVWKVKEWKYLSVNAHVIDARQSGFDLREWMDKKWIQYVDCLNPDGNRVNSVPQEGGEY